MAAPTVSEVVAALESEIDPLNAAVWDVAGLQVGDPKAEVTSIGVCHEITDAVVTDLDDQPVDLLVSYHPLLFTPVTSVVDGSSPSGRVFRLIKAGVAVWITHTAFDVADGGAADQLAMALELDDVVPFGGDDVDPTQGPGRVGSLRRPTQMAAFHDQVRMVLGAGVSRFSGDPNRTVARVATLPGSGGSHIALAASTGADLFVTGDVSHHEMALATDLGLSVIDAGHAATERPGIDRLAAIVAEIADRVGVAITRPLLPRP